MEMSCVLDEKSSDVDTMTRVCDIRAMVDLMSCAPEADRRNGRAIIGWSLAWAVSFVVAAWLLRSGAVGAGPMAWLLAVTCAAIGIGGLLAYRRYLIEADELARRIQLEGLAFGFGVGLLIALSYELFDLAGAPSMSAATVGTVLIVCYIVGVIGATLRYR